MTWRFTVNGERRSYDGPGMRRLLDVLREDLELPGTKEGCGEGECGACTVLLDGQAVVSCLVPVAQAAGRKVETVESLGRPDRLGPLQEAFLAHGAAQCGICTPGMLMTATAYLAGGGLPDAQAIRRELAGNQLAQIALVVHTPELGETRRFGDREHVGQPGLHARPQPRVFLHRKAMAGGQRQREVVGVVDPHRDRRAARGGRAERRRTVSRRG